jgi:hypothetical protein
VSKDDESRDDLAGTASRMAWRDVLDNSDEELPLIEACLYQPPWRIRLENGELGPEWGPDNPGAVHYMMAQWFGSRAGGGLWDDERAQAPSVLKNRVMREAQRYDSVEALVFLVPAVRQSRSGRPRR